MSVQSVKMMEDIQDKAQKQCESKAPFGCQCDKSKMINWVEDNWLDYVEDKHKHLFED
jgi:hypothetical protein